jgi:hypothetical protein
MKSAKYIGNQPKNVEGTEFIRLFNLLTPIEMRDENGNKTGIMYEVGSTLTEATLLRYGFYIPEVLPLGSTIYAD